MYEIKWDKRSGAIRLSESSESTVKGEVRPVFHEELDLLGFEAHWKYPKCEEPLLWAIGRKYYHKGEEVASTKGGGFYCKPNVTVHKKQLSLKPINVSKMIINNDYLLDGLQHRAIEFIARVYSDYLPKVDIASVAFSGGKDSLVLLDLVQRSLRPDQFIVTFSDTTMELDSTYETIERSKKYWSQLTFLEAKSPFDAKTSWRLFGPPSRILRWCCTVHKTAPSIAAIKEYLNRKAIRILVFDGCRRSESNRRAGYDDISTGKKHCIQTNASPILDWNSAEIYLYLFKYNIPLNRGYRLGASRIGCSVCPLGSASGHYLASIMGTNTTNALLEEIGKYASGLGIKKTEIHEFIDLDQWKVRCGGRGLKNGGNRVELINSHDKLQVNSRGNQGNWKEWTKVLKNRREIDNCRIIYETLDGFDITVCISGSDEYQEALFQSKSKINPSTIKDVRNLIVKDVYCVQCGACEAECPTGAIVMNDSLSIDEHLCIHCFKCVRIAGNMGCLVAKSLAITEGSKMKISTYQTFGLREEWVDGFIDNPIGWWKDGGLGTLQYVAMKSWLKHAGLLSKGNTPAEFLTLIGNHKLSGDLLWSVIWINLSMNSSLVRWYLESTELGVCYTKTELEELLPERMAKRSRKNAISALWGSMLRTPFANLGLGEVILDDKNKAVAIRRAVDNRVVVGILSYLLYQQAANNKQYETSVEEFINGQYSPRVLLGYEKDSVLKALRGLSISKPDIVQVEIVHDLDNIFLNENFEAMDVLRETIRI